VHRRGFRRHPGLKRSRSTRRVSKRAWDRKRGSAVRLMAVVLREDHEALQRRVCENEETAKTYAGAAEWLQRESAHLRKIARLLDTAGGRLAAVVSRCGESAAAQ
jgi:hypothetical protein